MEGRNGFANGPRARVLVIDDEDAIRRLVSLLLRDIADVDEAQSGDEAFRMIDKETPDLILLDARLPDMTGADVARGIRGRKDTRGTPIVMVTGDPDRPAADTGINSVLRKPFDLDELRDCVRGYLGV